MDVSKGFSRRALSLGALRATALRLTPAARAAEALPPSGGRFVSHEGEAANIALVRDFIGALEREDLDRMAALLADDCSFRTSQGRSPFLGKPKVMETLRAFCEIWDFELKIIQATALGPVVLNKREDILQAKDGWRSKLRIAAGMFFVDDGEIVEWDRLPAPQAARRGLTAGAASVTP